MLITLYECSPYPMETSLFFCNILAILDTIQLGEKLGGEIIVELECGNTLFFLGQSLASLRSCKLT
jgi:hypothetical protein